MKHHKRPGSRPRTLADIFAENEEMEEAGEQLPKELLKPHDRTESLLPVSPASLSSGLTLTHLRQIESYIIDRGSRGWYYGNKKLFEKRHNDLILWIGEAIKHKLREAVKNTTKG